MKNPYRDLLLLQRDVMQRQEEALRIAYVALDAVAAGATILTQGECDHKYDIWNIGCFLHFLYATLIQGMGHVLPEDFDEIKFEVKK